jgi:hypothetical protein
MIIKRYGDVFTEVGVLEREVHLEVNSMVQPVQVPPRRLLVATKDRVKAELDEM